MRLPRQSYGAYRFLHQLQTVKCEPPAPGDDGRFGAKAGDLPGILAFAGYVRARTNGAPDVAVMMFLSGLQRDARHRLADRLPQTPSQLLELSRVLAAATSRP